MKTTTTLEEIIRTSAREHGWDDIFNNKTGQMIRYGDESALTYQIATYSPLIQQVCNKEFFGGYNLLSSDADLFFKKAFVNRFAIREIKFQTLDMFRQRTVSLLAVNDQFISETYDNFKKFSSNEADSHSQTVSKTETNKNSDMMNKNRQAHGTLPQDTMNIDLKNDTMTLPDNLDYINSGTTQTDTGDSTTTTTNDTLTHNFSPDNLLKLNQIYEKLLDDFSKKLFLAVW